MCFHLGVCSIGDWCTIPGAQILEEDSLTGENHIAEVDELHVRHGVASVFGEVSEVVNGVEDYIDGLGEVKMHVDRL